MKFSPPLSAVPTMTAAMTAPVSMASKVSMSKSATTLRGVEVSTCDANVGLLAPNLSGRMSTVVRWRYDHSNRHQVTSGMRHTMMTIPVASAVARELNRECEQTEG